MVADTLAELHWAAELIGLERTWFQADARHPHYDVWGAPKKRLLSSGRVQFLLGTVTPRVLVAWLKRQEAMRRWMTGARSADGGAAAEEIERPERRKP